MPTLYRQILESIQSRCVAVIAPALSISPTVALDRVRIENVVERSREERPNVNVIGGDARSEKSGCSWNWSATPIVEIFGDYAASDLVAESIVPALNTAADYPGSAKVHVASVRNAQHVGADNGFWKTTITLTVSFHTAAFSLSTQS